MNPEDYEHYEAQGVLQNKQLENQIAINSPQLYESIQEQRAIMVEQTNPKKIVEDVMLRLRGVEKNPDGTEVQITESKMNSFGLGRIWFILESHINQNVILSHLESNDIKNIMKALQSDLVDCLKLNWKEFGIKTKTDLDDINNCILINIFLALKRAEGQNEKNWLGKISIENISGGYNLPKMKKESFWSKFKI